MLLASQSVLADADAQFQGEILHSEKCTGCHGTEVYTRENRRMTSLEALDKQVNFCMKNAAKANWTPAQTSAVVEYLNTKFYKF
jgi:hypothetical protein